jgi:flagellar assembly protein FliH
MSRPIFDTDLGAGDAGIVRAAGRIGILDRPRPLARFEIGSLEATRSPEAAESPPVPVPTFTEADLARACAHAYEAGVAEGRRAAEAERAERETAALAAIARSIGAFEDAVAAIRADALAQARMLGLEVARALVPAALADRPLADLEELLRLCVERLQDEPRLEVHTATELVEPCRERLEAIAATAEYRGDIIVHGDDAMGLGDVRLRWAEGGAERRLEVLREEALEVVARWLPVESD